MKILIADDEKLARFSLKSMLEEIRIPAAAIHLACDGEEMVELARRINPDIAFVDIKMPKLSGLEGILRARDLSPQTRWVILTGYSSFEYAKQALELGAAEYLLKPVRPQELSQTIARIMQEVRRDYLRLNEEFERRLGALFDQTLALNQERMEFISASRFLAALILFDSPIAPKLLLEYQLRFCHRLREKMEEVVGRTARIALCTLPDGVLALIGAWLRGEGEGEAREAIRSLFRKAAGPGEVCITFLCGEESSTFTALREQLRSLSEWAPLRAVLGIGGKLALEQLRQGQKREELVRLGRILVGLAEACREGRCLDFLQRGEELEGALLEARFCAEDWEVKNLLLFLKASLGFAPAAATDNRGWLGELKDRGRRQLAAAPGGGPGALVGQVAAYIDRNYMHDIGIARIACHLGITPNYLSALFHRKKGTTFLKYLTRVRLSRARELLLDPGRQVGQVAGQVGYSSARHFSRLFKLRFGCTPAQFQRSSVENSP